MDKLYKAVRDFVSPFLFSVERNDNTIVGVTHKTVFSPSIKVGYTHTSSLKKRGWQTVDICLNEIESISEYPIWGEDGGRSLQVDVLCCGYPETYIVDSKSTIFIQMYLDAVDKDIILMALDLETLETYIVNEVIE